MDFWDFVDEIAGEYEIEMESSYLSMPCGIYTGGETLNPMDESGMSYLKEYLEKTLKSYLNEAQRAGDQLTMEKWMSLMGLSLGKVIQCEWECRRNGLTEDRSLRRDYLEILKELKPEF